LDTINYKTIDFLGYEAGYKKSKVTGLDRLYYDRAKPKKMRIPYFNSYYPLDSIDLPQAYIIPAAWMNAIDKLELNGVVMKRLSFDTLSLVNAKYIHSYETVKTPYEGHYLHFNIETRDTLMYRQLYAGDVIVQMNQELAQFIGLALEPESPDSYFAWNLFDGILMQKEHFSPYVFEELAAEILGEDALLEQAFLKEKKQNAAFAKNSYAQLMYIYKRSKYYEPSHNLYPIYSIK